MENWRFIKENNDYMVSDHEPEETSKKDIEQQSPPQWL